MGHAPWIRTRKRNRWMRRIRRQIKIHKTRKEGGGDAESGPPETQKNGRNGGLGTHRYRRRLQRNPWSSKSKGREAFGHSHGVQGTPQKEKGKAKGGLILWNSSAEPGTVGGIQTFGRTAQKLSRGRRVAWKHPGGSGGRQPTRDEPRGPKRKK